MRGAGYEAVVFHRECPATKQASLRGAKRRGNLTISLARRVKNADVKLKWGHWRGFEY